MWIVCHSSSRSEGSRAERLPHRTASGWPAFARSALARLALVRLALVRLALVRLAPGRLAPARLALARLALGYCVAAACGCGHRTDLPQETGGGIIPASETYIVKQVWEGFDGASDIILTSGSQVFVSFPAAGQVVGYYSSGSSPRPNGKVLTGTAPTCLAEGPDRTLIVADSDSAGAIIRIFDQASTEELSTFRDTSWVEIGGLAADTEGNIFVSDNGQDLVRKYTTDGVVLIDLADEGDGIGFVRAPTGLDWQPDQVLVVDSGKQWVQVLDPDIENQAILFLDGSQSPNESFDALADVAGDDDGNLYVVDRTQATVLKYDGDGELDQRVELNAPDGTSGHLQEPVAVTANTRLAFVFDRADGTVVAFELDQ